MKALEIERFGDDVQGIRLHGDPKIRPEPMHVRIMFPGGDFEVVRCDDGTYWAHIRIDGEAETHAAASCEGKFIDARLDIHGQHAGEPDLGDFKHPGLYHVAVRVGRR